MGKQFDCLVIGGGPVGWLTALTLVQNGYKLALIAPPAPMQDQRTVALMQDTLSFLEGISLSPQKIKNATHLASIRIIDATKRLIRAPEVIFDAAEIGYPYFALNIPVRCLIDHIRQQIQGHANFVHIPHNAQSLVSHSNGISLTLENGKKLKVDFVIGADGRHSFVRKMAGIASRKWSYPQTALVSTFTHCEPHRNSSIEFHSEIGPFTLVPLQDNRSSVVCVVKPKEATYLMNVTDKELLKEFEHRSHFIFGQLSELGPRQCFPLSAQLAQSMSKERIFLVGESGHAFPPIGAQGLNLSIRDIATLHKLLESKPDKSDFPTLAKRYADNRHKDITKYFWSVDALNRSLLTEFIPIHFLRGLSLHAVKTVPFLRKTLMRQGLNSPIGQI